MASVDRFGTPLRDDPFRGNVRVVSTSNITLSGLQTIDGVTLESGDRVLVQGQSTTSENGIYVAKTSAWTRARDLSTSDDFKGPIYVTVEEGTTGRNTFYSFNPSTTITVGTDAITFTSGLSLAIFGDGDALSVLGRASNTAGNRDDIVATNDGEVLRRSGTSVGFGTVAAAGLASDSVTTAKILDSNVTTAKIADANVTKAKLENSTALSVIGRSANSSGVPTDIAASNDGEVLRRSGTALGFGKIVDANVDASAAIDAAKLSFTPAGTGAVARSIQAAMRERISVFDFGVTGDGSTDDSVNFQKAIDYAATVKGRVCVPATANGYVLSGLTVPSNVFIQGEGGRPIIIHSTASPLFTFSGGTSRAYVDNFSITSTSSTASTFYLDTSSSNVERIYVSNIETDEGYVFFSDANGTGIADEIYIDNCALRRHRRQGLLFKDVFAFLFVTRVFVDRIGSSEGNYNSFDLTGNEGAIFTNCDATGDASGSTTSQNGYVLTNCIAVWFVRCDADNQGGYGFFASGCSNIYYTECLGPLCANSSFFWTNCSYIRGVNLYAKGRDGLGYSIAAVPGFAIAETGGECSHFTLTGIQATLCTGDGILSDDGRYINISGLRSVGNVGWGLRTLETTSILNVTGAQIFDNDAGSTSFAGTLDRMSGVQINSGELSQRGHHYPNVTATWDLGSSSLKWGNLHLSGTVSVSTAGSVFGTPAGNYVSPTNTNTNLLLYNNSSTNYAGFGVDAAGNAYAVTGTSAPSTKMVWAAAEPTSGETVLLVRYHNGTAVSLSRVTVGAADSGGTGFKVLRVPN
jgi:hypothetical protein